MNNEYVIVMLGVLVFFVVSCSGSNIAVNIDDGMVKNDERYWECIENLVIVRHDVYDLKEDYNLTCDGIEFIINNWEREIDNFGRYHGVEKSIKIIKERTLRNTSLECGDIRYFKESTSIYLEGDFKKYYLNNCLGAKI